MQALEAAEKALQMCRDLGCDQADILVGQTLSASVLAFGGQAQNTEISQSQGLGVRIFRNGKPGYAYSERMHPDSIRAAVHDAFDLAEWTDVLSFELPPQSPAYVESWTTFDPQLEQCTLAEMTRTCLEVEKVCLESHELIANIPHLGAEKSISEHCLLNSSGFMHSEKSGHFGMGLGAVAVKNEVSKMGISSFGGLSARELDPLFIAKQASERAIELLDARPIQGGTLPILFNKRVSGQIFSLFSGIFSADAAQKGMSRLQGRLGETLASSVLDLWQQPHMSIWPGSSRWDSEGVPTQAFPVIQNGVFQTFLHNLETAAKDGVRPNGCASRSYLGRVGIGFANLHVLPGQHSEDALRALVPSCLEVVKLEGSTGCSAVSGQISIGVQGFLCQGGVRIHPVDRVTLSGDFFDLLQQIIALGDSYERDWQSYQVPSFLVEGMAVSS